VGKGRQEKPMVLRSALVALAGVGGLLALVVAAMAHADIADDLAHAVLIADAPNAAQGNAPDDVLAIVEGNIAHTTPQLQDEFVAFIRTQRQGTANGGLRDVVIEKGVQPLQIETQNGAVHIVNDDYGFDRRPSYWADVDRQHAPAGLTEGAIQITGFVRGSPIMAVGVSVAGGERQFQAQSIVLGPRDAYLQNLDSSITVERSVRNYALLLAPLLLAFAFWQGRRVMQG
jgi:hypothetical protein